MASWTNENTQSNFDARAAANNTINARSNSRSASSVGGGALRYGNASKTGTIVSSLREYKVVGLNVTKIPDMKKVITDYVTDIEGHLDKIEPLASANNAFKSKEVQVAVSNYIDTVKTYCKNLCSQLLAFNDKLQAVSNAWIAASSNMASTVNTSSDNLASDAGTRYEETVQASDNSGIGTGSSGIFHSSSSN